jgi:predicted O-linked N-acetylglucosamine transferase (SPINDLY family)
VTEPPALKSGLVTFGSYNTFAKVNDPLIRLWSQILRQVPTSRLRIVVPGGVENNRHVMSMLTGNGLPAERVDVVPSRPYRDYLASYSEIDIALDSYPYNGGATSLDAAFMGCDGGDAHGKVDGLAGWSDGAAPTWGWKI